MRADGRQLSFDKTFCPPFHSAQPSHARVGHDDVAVTDAEGPQLINQLLAACLGAHDRGYASNAVHLQTGLQAMRDQQLGATRLEPARRPLPVIGEWRDSYAING